MAKTPSTPSAPAAASVSDSPQAVSVSVGNSAPSPTPVSLAETPAVRRSTGRFMDVVHPSSDMRSRVAERPTPQPVENREEPSEEEAPSRHTDMPDPLDFQPTPEPAADAPLESPFLPDAKVEKKPLGAMPPVGAARELPELPELLQVPDEKLLEATVETEPEVPTSTPFTQSHVETPAEPQESGAIYDTETYHQPVVHPVKRKSGGLVALWIVLLVVVGAAAGAAVYFFVLPLL